jgi:hypothetical protein
LGLTLRPKKKVVVPGGTTTFLLFGAFPPMRFRQELRISRNPADGFFEDRRKKIEYTDGKIGTPIFTDGGEKKRPFLEKAERKHY